MLLSAATNESVSTGEIINIYSNDCESHVELFKLLVNAFRLMFQCIIVSYLLYGMLGPSFLSVFALSLTGMRAGKWFKSWKSKYKKAENLHSDERMKETAEAFKNIKTLKLNSWLNLFHDKISLRRG
jgi:hypothetical protein